MKQNALHFVRGNHACFTQEQKHAGFLASAKQRWASNGVSASLSPPPSPSWGRVGVVGEFDGWCRWPIFPHSLSTIWHAVKPRGQPQWSYSSTRPLFSRIWSCFCVNTLKASPLIRFFKRPEIRALTATSVELMVSHFTEQQSWKWLCWPAAYDCPLKKALGNGGAVWK